MRPDDVAAAYAVALRRAVGGPPAETEAALRQAERRVAHLQRTDPGGAWVAGRRRARSSAWRSPSCARGSGASRCSPSPRRTATAGIGRELLEASFGHGADARGHLILSTESPAAMRRYARLGLDLRPCVAAAGIVDRARLPAADGVVEAGMGGHRGRRRDRPRRPRCGPRDRPRGRARRPGARRCSSSRTAPSRSSATSGSCCSPRSTTRPRRACSNAALAATPPGATVSVDFLTAGQDWAVRACLDAGLVLSPDGPFFTGGDLGPLRPYVPTGAYL